MGRKRTIRQRHPVVLVPYLIEIDELMAPLLQECWRLGWHTRYSCQGSTSAKWEAYIVFRGPHAQSFQQAVLSTYPKWLHRIDPDDPEVIRFTQPGIEQAIQALKSIPSV